ncbi:MAG: hypothetical protein GC156_15595 [Actinomycetales bacterium]|nr:hypothetical protein [Actinomycetales bacterium]
MIRTSRLAIAAALAVVGATALSACSSSSSSSADAAASPSLVGGMTECTQENIAPVADEAAKALGADNTFELQDLQCADGWAVATGILGQGATASDAPQGAPTSFIFQAEGQFWVPQDKAKVCGTSADDATVPSSLYEAGCAAG